MTRTIMLVNEFGDESLIRATLEAEGYEVLSAGTGSEGLKTFMLNSIDLIIVFDLLPDLDGFTFTHTVKYLEPEIYTPIVMVTASWTQEDRDLALAAGAEDLVIHPIDPPDFLNRIRILLDLQEAREQALHSTRANASLKHQIEELELETVRLTEQCNQFFEMKLRDISAANHRPSPEEAETIIKSAVTDEGITLNPPSEIKHAQNCPPLQSFEPEQPNGWWDSAAKRDTAKQRQLAKNPRTA